MAKKAVATLKDKSAGKGSAKCIRMVRSERTGAYIFKEGIIPPEKEKDFFAGKEWLRQGDINEDRLCKAGLFYLYLQSYAARWNS